MHSICIPSLSDPARRPPVSHTGCDILETEKLLNARQTEKAEIVFLLENYY